MASESLYLISTTSDLVAGHLQTPEDRALDSRYINMKMATSSINYSNTMLLKQRFIGVPIIMIQKD
jgi:hypothetical protein